MSTSFSSVAQTSSALAAQKGRNAKRDRLVDLLRALDPSERRAAIAWLAGVTLQGKVGVGYRELSRVDAAPAASASLWIGEVDAAFDELSKIAGAGSAARRRVTLAALYARATAEEQAFLGAVLSGGLRQGGLDGVMIEAVALAAGVAADRLRRAIMLAGDLPSTAALALADPSALDEIAPQLFTPIEPMLASPSEGLEQAIAEAEGGALIEWKLDGARVQVHRQGEVVRVFTRALQEVTASVPEVVDAALALPVERLILDGETIAMRGDRPRPFQETQARFAKKSKVEEARIGTPLSVFFFDALVLDEVMLDRPLAERRRRLAEVVPVAHRLPSLETSDLGAARAFYQDAIARGHEGVMVKSLASTYEAGARGAAWQKVKRTLTLDLVVLAAEWGSGRRHGKLSNLHLGARNPSGGFVMLGKTFKGMTDEVLAWQTEQLLARETNREGHIVFVRPELVAEFAFDGVQQSPTYEGGLALRFARLVRYRSDKTPEQADTIDAVRRIFSADRGE